MASRVMSSGAPKKWSSKGSNIEKKTSSAAAATRNAGQTIHMIRCARCSSIAPPSFAARPDAQARRTRRPGGPWRRKLPVPGLDEHDPAALSRRFEATRVAAVVAALQRGRTIEPRERRMHESQLDLCRQRRTEPVARKDQSRV